MMKMKMMKKMLFAVLLSMGICTAALAQNKVVVIPLNTGSGANKIATVTSATGKVWMDRNLGALRVAGSTSDSLAYGWLYQWGRLADGHESRTSPTDTTHSSGDVPGHGDFITLVGSPYDWRTS